MLIRSWEFLREIEYLSGSRETVNVTQSIFVFRDTEVYFRGWPAAFGETLLPGWLCIGVLRIPRLSLTRGGTEIEETAL